jgi:hypothetical protein
MRQIGEGVIIPINLVLILYYSYITKRFVVYQSIVGKDIIKVLSSRYWKENTIYAGGNDFGQ